jgi:hypothetical protein
MTSYLMKPPGWAGVFRRMPCVLVIGASFLVVVFVIQVDDFNFRLIYPV